MTRAHRLGGRGVQHSRWSHLMVRLWGMAARDGAGPQAGGMGSLAELLVAAHGVCVGDANP